MSMTQGPFHERENIVVEESVHNVAAVPVEQFAPVATAVPAAPMVVTSPAQQIRTSSASRFAPDAMIAAIVGLVLLVVGLIAVVRAGVHGPMSDPVVNVLGFTHTATLGFIEIGLGICLLLSGASQSRSASIFFGGVLGVAAFVGAVQTTSFRKSLALESSMAWLAVVAAVVVVFTALLLPRFANRTAIIEQR